MMQLEAEMLKSIYIAFIIRSALHKYSWACLASANERVKHYGNLIFLKKFKSNTYDRIVKENRNKRLKVKHKHTIFVEKLKIKN